MKFLAKPRLHGRDVLGRDDDRSVDRHTSGKRQRALGESGRVRSRESRVSGQKISKGLLVRVVVIDVVAWAAAMSTLLTGSWTFGAMLHLLADIALLMLLPILAREYFLSLQMEGC